jgi:hypothetical protein
MTTTEAIDAAKAVEMRGHIPGAQLAVLPGTTHMGVLRRSDVIVPLVTGFLAS